MFTQLRSTVADILAELADCAGTVSEIFVHFQLYRMGILFSQVFEESHLLVSPIGQGRIARTTAMIWMIILLTSLLLNRRKHSIAAPHEA